MTRKTTISLFLLGALAASLAQAGVITVNTTDDENGTGSKCSLREAVKAAELEAAFGGCTAGSGTDTIVLQDTTTATGTGTPYVISKKLGSILIKSPVTFQGANTKDANTTSLVTGTKPSRVAPKTLIMAEGSSLPGAATLSYGTDRLFLVTGTDGVSFNDVVLTGGHATTATDTATVRYLGNGGAIWSAAPVNFDNAVLTHNAADGQGGGVFLAGSNAGISSTVVTFDTNISATGGAAIGMTCFAAAAPDVHSVALRQALIFNNTSSDSDLTRNGAVTACGNVTLQISDSTVAFNSSAGVIVNNHSSLYTAQAASLSLVHVTILGQSGIGLDLANLSNNGTISGLSITNSLLAFNYGANCTQQGSGPGNSFAPTYNWIGDNCPLITPSTQNFQPAALSGTASGSNFGTQFYAQNPVNKAPLLYGGLNGAYFPRPAAVFVGQVKAANCDTADQRGAPRNALGTGCTAGALEPKVVHPVDDTGQNDASGGPVRSVTVSLLDNDQGGESGDVTTGQIFKPVSIVTQGMSFTERSTPITSTTPAKAGDCVNLNGGTITFAKDADGNFVKMVYTPKFLTVEGQGQLPLTDSNTGLASAATCYYSVQDASGATSDVNSPAGVTMTVTNLAPSAKDDTYIRPYDGNPFAFNPLTNDTDADGKNGKLPPSGVSMRTSATDTSELRPEECRSGQYVQIVTKPQLGTVSGRVMATVLNGVDLVTYYDGALVYTPSNSFSPFTDSFSYQVLDSDCQASNSGTVTIKVDAPPAGGAGSADLFLLVGGFALLGLRRKPRL